MKPGHRQSIDLVAEKDGERIAIEIETGKNSKKQMQENVIKCLKAGFKKVYVVGRK